MYSNDKNLSCRPFTVDCKHCINVSEVLSESVSARMATLTNTILRGQDFSDAQQEDAALGSILEMVWNSDNIPP